jgi:hypothetical protein
MGILGSRTKRSWDFGGWWRGYFAAGKKTTSLFAEDPARVERERGAWRRTAELLKTAP